MRSRADINQSSPNEGPKKVQTFICLFRSDRAVWPGTDVIIFKKYFRQKMAKRWRFSQDKAKFYKKIDHHFCQKSQKIVIIIPTPDWAAFCHFDKNDRFAPLSKLGPNIKSSLIFNGLFFSYAGRNIERCLETVWSFCGTFLVTLEQGFLRQGCQMV
jgi:hypothetical protein